MKRNRFIVLIALLALFVCGCTSQNALIRQTIAFYNADAPAVKLGDRKDDVLAVLDGTQQFLPANARKNPESYLDNGVLVEIHFYRSGLQDDGLTTDDEFTPYVFRDGVLEAIGWTVLGGPKTQGQTRDEVHIERSPGFPFWY